MKKHKKAHSNIDLAFSNTLELIGKKRGSKKKNICLRLRFLGEKKIMEVALFRKKNLSRLKLKELICKKMIALRYSAEDFYFSFSAFHEAMVQQFKVKQPNNVALLIYESPKSGRPLLVACIEGRPLHSMFISDMLATINMGDEQLN